MAGGSVSEEPGKDKFRVGAIASGMGQSIEMFQNPFSYRGQTWRCVRIAARGLGEPIRMGTFH